ncbi:hypothetical protein H4R19_000676 [Coemansia spiralis]|nr:hypothetical protein H4R19_000676 [Coemansia spiralis]
MGGFNGTIFAYGQTSSGKTHTMHGSGSEPGIIKLAVKEMFDIISNDPSREYLVRVSFLEIYNEVLRDLIEPTKTNLKIHENAKREIFVGDLSEHIVFNPDQVEEILLKGDRNRHIAGTNMNERSSRSHTIFRMVIESREKVADSSVEDSSGGIVAADDEQERARRQQRLSTSSLASADEFTGAVMVSCLNLVDLAGSERVGQTGAEGQRLKEGAHINKSLLSLGTVIARLSEDGGDRGHIPYRDSKLTRILQPSLGGNARTLIICTITPSPDYIDEALSTLKFASRAKTIRNTPEVNEELRGDALLRRLKRASELEKEVAQMREIERKKIKIEADNEALLRQLWKSQKERERLQHELAMQQSKVFLPAAPDAAGAARRQTWFPGLQGPLADGAVVDADAMDTDGDAGLEESGATSKLYRSAMARLAEIEAQNETLRTQHNQADKRGRDTQTALERLIREHDLLLATLNQLAEADVVPPSPARRGPDAPPRELVYIRRKIRALMKTIEASQKQCQKFRSQRPEAEFLEMELQAARETLAQKDAELVESMRESDTVFAKLRDAESAHAAVELTCQELREDLLAERQGGEARLQSERASAEALLERTVVAHRAQIEELESAASQQQHDQEVLQHQLACRIQDSEAEASAARASAEQTQERCDKLAAQLRTACNKADALADERRALAAASAQTEAAGIQATEELRAELARLRTAEERLQSDLASLQAQLSSAQATAATHEADIREKVRAAAESADKASQLQAVIRTLQAQVAEAESDGRTQAANLSAALAERTAAADQLGVELQATAEQHRRAEEDKAQLAAELAALRQEASAAAADLSADLTAAREELAAKQEAADAAQHECQRVQIRIEQLEAENADVWERVSELSMANGDLSAKIASAEELEAKQASRISALEVDVAAATDMCRELRLDASRAAGQHQCDLDAAEAAQAELQADMDAQLAGQREAIACLEQSVAAGERQLAEQRQQHSRECERAAQLESSLAAERAALQSLESAMAASDESSSAMAVLNTDLRAQLEAKTALAADLEQRLLAASESRDAVLREIDGLQQDRAAEEERLGALVAALETELSTARSRGTEDAQAHQAHAAEVQAELADLRQQLAELTHAHKQASEALEEAERGRSALAEELAQATDGWNQNREAMAQERQRLETIAAEQASKHASDLAAAEQTRADLESTAAQLHDELAAAQGMRVRLEEQVAAMASERDSAASNLADSYGAAEESRRRAALLECDIAQLNQRLDARSAEVDELRAARDQLQGDLDVMIQRARESQAELEQAAAAMKSELSSKDIALGELETALDAATAEAERARAEARTEADGLRGAVASLEDRLAESQAAVSALRAEAACGSTSAQSAVEELERALSREQANVETLKGMMTELARVKDDEITGLEQQLEQHQELLETSVAEGLQKDDAIQRLEDAQTRDAATADELRTQCQDLQAKLDDAAALACQLQSELGCRAAAETGLQAQLDKQAADLLEIAQSMRGLPGCSDDDIAAVSDSGALADILAAMGRMVARAASAGTAASTAAGESGRLEQEIEQLRSLNSKLEKKNDKLRDMYKADTAELHAEGEKQRQRAGALDAELARSTEKAAGLLEQLVRAQEDLAEHQRRSAVPVPTLQLTPRKTGAKRPRAPAPATPDGAADPPASMLEPVPPSRLNARPAAAPEDDDCPPRKRTVAAAGAPAEAKVVEAKTVDVPPARSSYGDRRRTRRNQPAPPSALAEQSADQCVQQ